MAPPRISPTIRSPSAPTPYRDPELPDPQRCRSPLLRPGAELQVQPLSTEGLSAPHVLLLHAAAQAGTAEQPPAASHRARPPHPHSAPSGGFCCPAAALPAFMAPRRLFWDVSLAPRGQQGAKGRAAGGGIEGHVRHLVCARHAQPRVPHDVSPMGCAPPRESDGPKR